jgi:hypothetical protein
MTRRHVGSFLDKELWARAGGVAYRNLGIEDAGDPLPTGSSRGRRARGRPLRDHRSGILILFESGVHGSPALIAVEAESATDLPHRVTHAFLAATEVATDTPAGGRAMTTLNSSIKALTDSQIFGDRVPTPTSER